MALYKAISSSLESSSWERNLEPPSGGCSMCDVFAFSLRAVSGSSFLSSLMVDDFFKGTAGILLSELGSSLPLECEKCDASKKFF